MSEFLKGMKEVWKTDMGMMIRGKIVEQEDTRKFRFEYLVERGKETSMVMTMPLRSIMTAKALKELYDFGLSKLEVEAATEKIRDFIKCELEKGTAERSCENASFDEIYKFLSEFVGKNAYNEEEIRTERIGGVFCYCFRTDVMKKLIKMEFGVGHLQFIRTLKDMNLLKCNKGRNDFKLKKLGRFYCFVPYGPKGQRKEVEVTEQSEQITE